MGCSASRPEIFLNKALEGCACYYWFTSTSRPCPTSTKAPKTRSLPAPVVHHPPIRKGDSHHLVSLISSTYGSLIHLDHNPTSDGKGFAHQSYSPESVINAWELMEGLDDQEDDSDFSSCRHSLDNCCRPNFVKKSSDWYPSVQASGEIEEEWKSNMENSNTKPLWRHLSEETLQSKLDSSSRRFRIARTRIKTRSVDSSSVNSGPLDLCGQISKIPGCEDKIVIYFTSLRGIRKTYDDCCAVRMIFKMLKVGVDERDVCMDLSYRKELKYIFGGKSVSLPQVFIRGKHVGGVEEMKKLNEDGELNRLIDGLPVLKGSGLVCRSCGDARFVLCSKCHGSRKILDDNNGERRRCLSCNENGLIRCSACCYHLNS